MDRSNVLLKDNIISGVIAKMTKDEHKEIIETTVERELLKLLGDPEEGLELRKNIRARLLRQKKAVAKGERGQAFKDVVSNLSVRYWSLTKRDEYIRTI